MAEESVIKSIIYGNAIQNTLTTKRALCCAINSRDSVDRIVLYLRQNANFLKYNKYVYAYRVQPQSVPVAGDGFLTELGAGKILNANPQRFLEGYLDDQCYEGAGPKLLALLQKFNVRNVLVVVAIRDRRPLRDHTSSQMIDLIKSVKDLLSTLYDKVIVSQETPQTAPINTLKINSFHPSIIALTQQPKKVITRPNYVGQSHVKKPQPLTLSQKYRHETNFLNNKIRELASILQEVIEQFGETENQQVRYALKYQQNKQVLKALDLVALLFGCSSRDQFQRNNISDSLKSITNHNLHAETIRKLNEQLLSNPQLRPHLIAKTSRVCGLLMEFLEVLLKSYSFAKRLAILESQIEEQQQNNVKEPQEPEGSFLEEPL